MEKGDEEEVVEAEVLEEEGLDIVVAVAGENHIQGHMVEHPTVEAMEDTVDIEHPAQMVLDQVNIESKIDYHK